jgi:HipA-like protein
MSKTKANAEIRTPLDEVASFELSYKNLSIGHLELQDGNWRFYYSEEFKSQDVIKPLIDFPNQNKTYSNKELWPFFSYRIPGLSQPAVKEIIKKEAIDSGNEVALLKKFGKYSIFNPFLLIPEY